MTTVKKIYLPLWMAWFSQVFIVAMWSLVTYQAFFQAAGRPEQSMEKWIFVTALLAGVSVMLLLMGYRKLPAYVIEEGQNDGTEKSRAA